MTENSLGIEFGSTRIKAILVESDGRPIASGNFEWENEYNDGIFTYSEHMIKKGLASCWISLKKDYLERYGSELSRINAMGVSAMMHGYIALDADGHLLTPFRTWRNTITETESEELTELFGFNIPQRWTVAHLYKDIKAQKGYLSEVDYVTTLAGYIHYMLTGEKVLGIDDASGLFPIDPETGYYNKTMLSKFNELIKSNGFNFTAESIFPTPMTAGKPAGRIKKESTIYLDGDDFLAGTEMCPPEGDAGTGMVATNSIKPNTGNVSAGTSVFAMIVLDRKLKGIYRDLDMVMTPDGKTVAMAHSNNCTGEYDNWIRLFAEVLKTMGMEVRKPDLYDRILGKTLEGKPDCGGLVAYNYLSGEHITGITEGRPLIIRNPETSEFNLSNFMRCQLYSALASMRIGLDHLFNEEGMKLETITGHGGFFKTEEIGQLMMSAATGTPVSIMTTAGEGGAWGIAILASYIHASSMNLESYLDDIIFKNSKIKTLKASNEDIMGFNRFLESYKKCLELEKFAHHVI